MASEIRQTVDDIFHVACELAPEKRQPYLERACAGNVDLRREIEELLHHYEAKDTFLERPALHDEALRLARDQRLFTTRDEISAAQDEAGEEQAGRGALVSGRYRVLDPIGKGGMGIVYLAVDELEDREVAIKVLPENFVLDEDRLARFNREARMLEELKRLKHPNIAEIYEQGEFDGKPCLVLEYAPGETLADRLSRGPMTIEEALHTGVQIADALSCAHEQRIVHRDLKPANIKITPEGRVKVLDFGLAKRFYPDVSEAGREEFQTKSLSLTESGMLIGTPAYMSPEQWDGREIDQRADLWAFGCLLYEMLAGIAPFARQTRAETMKAAFYAQPDWAALPAGTPIIVQDLLRSCLHKDAGQRLAAASGARNSLAEAINKNRSTFSLVLKSWSWKLDRKIVAGIAAAGLALGLFIVWKYTSLPDKLFPPKAPAIILTAESDLTALVTDKIRGIKGADAQLVRAAMMPDETLSKDLLTNSQGQDLIQNIENKARIDEIINELKKSIDIEGEKAQLYAILAQAHLFKLYLTSDAGEKDKALQAVNRAMSLNPESGQVLIVQGNVLNAIGRHDKAIEIFERAKSSDGNNPDILLGLALAHDFSGDEKGLAEGLYKAAIEARKTRSGPFWEDYNDIGWFYRNRGEYEKAADAWREVININPLSPTGYINLGNAYLDQGCFNLAEETYRKSITSGGPTEDAYTNLGAAYFFLSNYNDSIRYLQQITQNEGASEKSSMIEAWNNLGDSYRLNGNPVEAAGAYRTALALLDKELMRWKDDLLKVSLQAEVIAKLNSLGQGAVEGDPISLVEKTLDPKLECSECQASAAIIYRLARRDRDAARSALNAVKNGYSPFMIINNPDLDKLNNTPEFKQIHQEAQKLRGKC